MFLEKDQNNNLVENLLILSEILSAFQDPFKISNVKFIGSNLWQEIYLGLIVVNYVKKINLRLRQIERVGVNFLLENWP